MLVLKMVEPGEIMGLSAMISGELFEVTAETVGPCLVNFVEPEGLLRLMEQSGELGLRSAQAVSREFQFTQSQTRSNAYSAGKKLKAKSCVTIRTTPSASSFAPGSQESRSASYRPCATDTNS